MFKRKTNNGITLCTGSLGCSGHNDVAKMAAKYAAMGRIHFVHMRNVAVLENGFEERAHLSSCGTLDMYAIMKALYDNGFDGYIRPDHGRMIWGETGRPGYGLYDRALGAAYLAGLAVGFWRDTDELRQLWREDATLHPSMEPSKARDLLAGWHKAVGRSLDWALH